MPTRPSLAIHSTHPQRAASLSHALCAVGIEAHPEAEIWLLDGAYPPAPSSHPVGFIWLAGGAVPAALQSLPHHSLSLPIRPHALLQAYQQLKQMLSAPMSENITRFDVYAVQLSPAQIITPTAPIALTESLAQMLALLVRHPDGVAKDIFLQQLWPHWQNDTDTHSFDTQLYRLRQKLAALAPNPIEILLENGLYRLHP